MQGRRAEADRTFERLLTAANDLGLPSEEYDVGAGRLSGNFPQALSHLAVVRTALRFDDQASDRGEAMRPGRRPTLILVKAHRTNRPTSARIGTRDRASC